MDLLIHGDPGARNGFVGAWLTKSLLKTSFDVGEELAPTYTKIHNFSGNNKDTLEKFSGVRIRIRPTLEMIDTHILLFLRKNVHTQLPNFTRDEYSFETFSKLWNFIKECFVHDTQINYSLYDYVINFEDTYNLEAMINLYQKVLLSFPSDHEIQIFHNTNSINRIPLDINHSASLIKFILKQETHLGVSEQQRHWSIVDIYRNTNKEQLHTEIKRAIIKENYAAA